MLHTLMRIIRVAIAFFLVILIGFEIVPISSERDTQQYIVEAGFQRGRSQQIERAAYTLHYGPQSEKTQAINDLQTSLFAFQQEQALLWKNSDQDVQRSLYDAQADYIAIVAAAQAILEHPKSLIELNIILRHSQRLFQAVNDLVILLEQHLTNRIAQLLVIRIIMMVICILLLATFLFLDHYASRNRKVNAKRSETTESEGTETRRSTKICAPQ